VDTILDGANVDKEGLTIRSTGRKDRDAGTATPWELGKGLFGSAGSGRSDLSSKRKAAVGEKIRAKKERRRLGP
jgi:hypothetical protein